MLIFAIRPFFDRSIIRQAGARPDGCLSTRHTFYSWCPPFFIVPSFASLLRSYEGPRRLEHQSHVRNIRHIPPADIPIEVNCATEHIRHVSDMWHIPHAEIPVKTIRIPEHPRHVSDTGHIPMANISIERTCPLNISDISVTCDTSHVSMPKKSILCVNWKGRSCRWYNWYQHPLRRQTDRALGHIILLL